MHGVYLCIAQLITGKREYYVIFDNNDNNLLKYIQDRKKFFYPAAAAAILLLLLLIIGGIRSAVRFGKKQHEPMTEEILSEQIETETETGIQDVKTHDALSGIGAERSPYRYLKPKEPPVDKPFFIIFVFDEHKEILTRSQTVGWRMEQEGEILWDDEKIYAYVEGLKEKYDVIGPVKFITHTGEVLYIDSPNCNWNMNVDMTVDHLKAAVTNGSRTVDPIWNSGLVYCSENGVGKKYLEVSISEQKVYLIENDELIYETNCVTGTPDGQHDTVKGVFQIQFKAYHTTLIGENNSYQQDVDYWLPFNGAQGLHDATWRYDFGGDIYLYNGSHGCVNLPHEAAERIYQEVYMWYPVVVY